MVLLKGPGPTGAQTGPRAEAVGGVPPVAPTQGCCEGYSGKEQEMTQSKVPFTSTWRRRDVLMWKPEDSPGRSVVPLQARRAPRSSTTETRGHSCVLFPGRVSTRHIRGELGVSPRTSLWAGPRMHSTPWC